MNEFSTVHDMLNHYYGRDVTKADAPVLSTTTGVHNDIFGAQAFSQLNNESNAFGLLPKRPWNKSGWRVITADAGTTADGGTAENAALPETVKPTFAEVSMNPKQVVHTFDVSYLHENRVQKGDDSIGDMQFLRGYFATLHAKRINEQLLVDADTLAGNNFESIDRVTFSDAAETALSYTAGDADIYDIDRSAASWSDAVVSHNSGTDRVLSDELIRDTLATVRSNGGRTNVILTGNDTYFRLVGLYENQVRYPGVLNKSDAVTITINGVSTATGADVGQSVASIYGIPVFTSQAVAQDTISRIYLLDTTDNDETGVPRLFIALLNPTLYAESGMGAADKNPFGINRLGTEGMYYTAGELVCTFFKGQASIRDLK